MPTIYRFPILYRLAMRVGYGTDYGPRHALVAPAGAASTCAPSMCARVARCPWPARPLCRQAHIGSTTSPTPASTPVGGRSAPPRRRRARALRVAVAGPRGPLDRADTHTDRRSCPHLPLYRGDAARPRSALRHPVRRFDRTPSGREVVVCSVRAP